MLSEITTWIMELMKTHGPLTVVIGVLIESVIVPIPSPLIIMGAGVILIEPGLTLVQAFLPISLKIVLPGAFPGILSGLRVSIAIAIILLVAAEMLGAEYGVGSYILEAGSLYDLERLFAGVTILSVMGLIVSWLIGRIEHHFLGWRG